MVISGTAEESSESTGTDVGRGSMTGSMTGSMKGGVEVAAGGSTIGTVEGRLSSIGTMVLIASTPLS